MMTIGASGKGYNDITDIPKRWLSGDADNDVLKVWLEVFFYNEN